MSISVTCPGCDRGLKAPDTSAGRKIKCPKCGSAVPVPDADEDSEELEPQKKKPVAAKTAKSSRRDAEEDEDRPRRRSREDDDEDEEEEAPRRKKKKRKSKQSGVGLWVGIGVGALLLLVVIVVIVLLNNKTTHSDPPTKQVVQEDKKKKKPENKVEEIINNQGTPTLRNGSNSELSQSRFNLKQLALGMHNYHATFNKFPKAAITNKEGKPLLSWRVALLPFVEQGNLYKQFKLDEPWDSAHNKKLIVEIPSIYQVIPNDPNGGKTYYQVFTGKLGPFGGGQSPRIASFSDGTSNTFLIAEGYQTVIWTKPDDMEYDGGHKFKDGVPITKIGQFANMFQAAMADGSSASFERSVSAEQIHALITASGGETITLPK